MSGQKTRPTALDWGLLGLLGLIWGGAFLGVEMGLDSLAPLWVSTGRIVLAAVVLTAITFIWGNGLPKFDTPLQRRVWLHCFGMGMFTNAIPFSLLAWGQQIVSSGFAGITMAVVPLLVLPLSHFLIPGERLTPARLVGFLIGFAGVVLLIGGDRLFSDMAVGDGAVLGAQMACVAASCCYACGSIITRLCPPVSTMSFAAAGLICASLVLLPLALYVEGPPDAISARAAGGVLYLALLPTGAATIMLTVLIRRAGPPFLSLVNYQVPVWAVLIGVVILAEALPGHFITALAIILGGVAISQFVGRARARA